MSLDLPLLSSHPIVGWMIVAVAALVAIWIVLKIVHRAIKVSVRLVIVISVLVLIAAGLCWLSSAWGGLLFS